MRNAQTLLLTPLTDTKTENETNTGVEAEGESETGAEAEGESDDDEKKVDKEIYQVKVGDGSIAVCVNNHTVSECAGRYGCPRICVQVCLYVYACIYV